MYKPINEGGANMLNKEFFHCFESFMAEKIIDSPDSNWSALGRFNLEK